MAEPFDAYHKWLGIPPKDQPPHHYRLLGIELFEADADVIDAAANRLAAYLEGCSQGAHSADLQRLLADVAAARKCLLDAARKAQYDGELRRKMGQTGQEQSRRGQRPTATAAPESPGAEAPFALSFADRPVPAKASEPSQPDKAAKGRPKARSWKEYALWVSPALVLLVVAGIYLATRGPRQRTIIKQEQKRPVFNSAADAKAGFEPVKLQSLAGNALDDNSAETSGSWLAMQDARDKYVGRYYKVANSGDHVARFPVPVSGAYEVRMSYVPAPNRATNVKVRIFPADGKPVTVTVNQRAAPAIDGLFHSLGTFTFGGSPDERIEISAQGADGSVVADAVQFVRAASK